MRDLTPDEILWCEWVQTLPKPEITRHEQATGLSIGGFQAGLAAGRAQVRRELEPVLDRMAKEGRGLVVSHLRFELDRICRKEVP